MSLPFSFAGRVVVAEQSDVSLAALKLERALDDVGAKQVKRVGHQIRFTGGIFRAVSGNNLLLAIGSGELSLEPSGTGLAIAYHLRFTQMFLVVSIAVIAFFGPPIVGAPNLTPVEAAALLSLAWLWLYGMNVLLAVIRVPRWIRRTLVIER
jgi:hypothetical protein